MLTTFYPPWGFGGDAIQVERLAIALAARGHQVTVVHSPQAYRALALGSHHERVPDNGAGGADAGEHPGVRRVPIDAALGTLSPFATYMTGRPLLTRGPLEQILEEEFDVLHFHNPSLLGGPSLLRMGSGLKLYTAHEQWLVCPTHVLWKFRTRVCEEEQCWRCSAIYRRPPQPWRSTGLLDRCISELDALIAPSRATAELHSRFAPMVRIAQLGHFVPECSPPDAGAPAPAPHGGRPYFLFVGRLESIKGVEILLEAFRRRRTADLLVAGTGSLERRLRRAAADLPNVRFLGWVPSQELDPFYRGALAVLVPTRGHESFGLVPVEAFARGTPAVVHDFGALAELAEESGAALSFRSAAELDEALARLADDEGLRWELSARARSAHLRKWTPEAHLRGYLGLIAELAWKRGDGELADAAAAAVPGQSQSGATA